MKKQFLSLTLALALCLGLAVPAFGAVTDFTVKNGVLTKYNGPGGDVVLPDNVTSIDKEVFSNYDKLTSLTIPSSVTEIGYRAFYKCSNLVSITIPDSVTSIGNSAFSFCTSLKSVTIPSGMTTVVDGMFYQCTSLSSVTIPDSVTSIGPQAFLGCSSLKSVTIPSSVTTIGKQAFQECSSLTDINLPKGVTGIAESTFAQCTSLADVTIPGSVKTIESQAFANCSSLAGVVISDGVVNIESSAFSNCKKLTSMTIPSSVTNISSGALNGCDSLTIYGKNGSEAQSFARKKGIPFEVGQAPAAKPATSTTVTTTYTQNTAYASTQSVLVNGSPVEFQCYALKDKNGNDTNYIKLRDLAYILNGTAAQFEVGWNGAVTIQPGESYTANGTEMSTPFYGNRTYETATAPTYVNGAVAGLDAIVLKDDQGGAYTYYKLRDLGAAIGFVVDWSADKGIFIEAN